MAAEIKEEITPSAEITKSFSNGQNEETINQFLEDQASTTKAANESQDFTNEIGENEEQKVLFVKIYAGNLSYNVNEDALSKFFNDSGVGEVKQCQVIKSYGRSRGYGFVSFSTKEEAEAAVETLNKKEFLGRHIQVELARTPDSSQRRNRPGYRRYPPVYFGGYYGGYSNPHRGGYGMRRGRGRGFGRRIYSRQQNGRRIDEDPSRKGNEQEITERTHEEGQNGTSEMMKEAPARAGPREGRGYRHSESRRDGRFYGRGGGRYEHSEDSRGRRSGEPSPTTPKETKNVIFVANLPFALSNEDLKTVFSEYKVTNAYIPRRFGRSRGYGFVEAESEEERESILQDLKNVVVDGRELVLKAAHEKTEGSARGRFPRRRRFVYRRRGDHWRGGHAFGPQREEGYERAFVPQREEGNERV